MILLPGQVGVVLPPVGVHGLLQEAPGDGHPALQRQLENAHGSTRALAGKSRSCTLKTGLQEQHAMVHACNFRKLQQNNHEAIALSTSLPHVQANMSAAASPLCTPHATAPLAELTDTNLSGPDIPPQFTVSARYETIIDHKGDGGSKITCNPATDGTPALQPFSCKISVENDFSSQQPEAIRDDTIYMEQNNPASGFCKQTRKRRKRSMLRQEQLDAKYPGNARHHQVVVLLQPALRQFAIWLEQSMAQGCLPWVQGQQQRQQQQAEYGIPSDGIRTLHEQQQEQQQQAEDGVLSDCISTPQGQQQQQAEDDPLNDGITTLQEQQQEQQEQQRQQHHDVSEEVQANDQEKQTQQLRMHAQQPQGQPRVDWLSLYALRHTLKPKIWLPSQCPAAMAGVLLGSKAGSMGSHSTHHYAGAAAAARDLASCCSCTCSPTSTSCPAGSAATAATAWKANNLFGSVVRNPHCQPVIAQAHDQAHVVLPPGSSFLMSHGVGTLGSLLEQGLAYRLIVIDPPWENASVKRSNKYSTLPARELLRLPLPHLIHKTEGLVALWITNRDRLHRFVHQELLPRWGLSLLRTWLWVKVDKATGMPISPLACLHRHCYEHLLLLVPTCQHEGAAAGVMDASLSMAEDEPFPEAGQGGSQASEAGTLGGHCCAEPPLHEQSSHALGTASLAAATATGKGGHALHSDDASELQQPSRAPCDMGSVEQPGSSFPAAAQVSSPWACLPADGFTLFCCPEEHSRKPFLGDLLQHLVGLQETFAGTQQAMVAWGHVPAAPAKQLQEHLSELAPQAVLTMAPAAAAAGLPAAPVAAAAPPGSDPQLASSANASGASHLAALPSPAAAAAPCLELFARELHAGWTSWGNEVLHFQEVVSTCDNVL